MIRKQNYWALSPDEMNQMVELLKSSKDFIAFQRGAMINNMLAAIEQTPMTENRQQPMQAPPMYGGAPDFEQGGQSQNYMQQSQPDPMMMQPPMYGQQMPQQQQRPMQMQQQQQRPGMQPQQRPRAMPGQQQRPGMQQPPMQGGQGEFSDDGVADDGATGEETEMEDFTDEDF